MANANAYDPSDLLAGLVSQYVTPTADAPAFITAYGEIEQTLTELSPAGVKVQANTLNTWP
jgi:hypothetical protein